MNDKTRRSRRGTGDGHSNTTVSTSRRKPPSLILVIVCGFCAFLVIICCCLTALVVVLEKKLKIGLDRCHDLNQPEPYVNMACPVAPCDLSFRLAKEVKPLHYDIILHPDLDKGTFRGNVTIRIEIHDRRSYIALHQKDLNIVSASLKSDDEYECPIEKFETIQNLEELIVKFKTDLLPGFYNLSFEFNGALKPDKTVGFFGSVYKDEDDRTRQIATSKFEPTYARRAFPCFDEPAFKAKFSVRLVHPSKECYGALSNMNVKSTMADEPSAGLTTVTFDQSVPMSTYLVCFIVSDFYGITATARNLDGNSFPISVYANRAHKEKTRFALETGVKLIEYYIKLFKINYPLPKLDMAAIPDSMSGAMENWGLVTYKEARIFYDKQTSSTTDQEQVVLVIGHEFAHMWFGNLVTMAWWNDLWLNEGFATFMQYKSSNKIFHDWGFMDQFLTDVLHPVLIADAKLSSHPIVQTVDNPDEITAIFDVITYNKGASVLRMLNNFVGSDIFDAGVTDYLNKFAYQNARTEDLFGILQKAIGGNINVTEIMDTWTRQMGYPVVNVVRNGLNYTLTQKRFLSDREAQFDPTESNYGYKWTIPITYITSKSSKDPILIWFDKDATELKIKLDEPVEWIKFNYQQIGFYRVNYATEEWEKLSQILQTQHKKFLPADRVHLLEEVFSLARASEIEYKIALNLATYIRIERSARPWNVAASKFSFIDKFLASTDFTTKYREWVRDLVSDAYRAVTWKVDEYESHDMLNLRRSVLSLACAVGHQECLDEAGARFKAWINDTNDVRPAPDVRGLIYYYGMNHVGEEAEWDIMFQRFVNEGNSAEKIKLMNGLAGIRSSRILKKFITIAVDDSYVRHQDAFSCLSAIARNPVGTPLVWDWIRENWEFLVKRYTLNDRYLGRLIPEITSSFATDVKLTEMRNFFAKYPNAGAGKSARASALETVNENIKWVQRNSRKIETWLDSLPK